MKRNHCGILVMIIAIFLTISFAGCSSPQKEDGKHMDNEEKELYGRIVPPEGFVEGTSETENVMATYKRTWPTLLYCAPMLVLMKRLKSM